MVVEAVSVGFNLYLFSFFPFEQFGEKILASQAHGIFSLSAKVLFLMVSSVEKI